MPSESKKKSVSEKWEEFCNETSCHGFNQAFTSKSLGRRVFWCFWLVGMIGLAAYLFYGVIGQYASNEFNVSKEIRFDLEEVDFPRVTICNTNPSSNTKLQKIGYPGDEKELLTFYQEIRGKVVNMSSPTTKNVLNHFYSKNLNTTHEIISALEIGKEEMFNDPFLNTAVPYRCQFDGKRCGVDQFTETYSERSGKCVVFSNDNKVVLKSKTESNGLQLIMNLHGDERLENQALFNGLVVFIHPHQQMWASALAKKVYITPGTINNIQVSISKLQALPPPYSPKCGTKDFEIMDNTYTYSENLCITDCLAKQYYESCKCLPSHLIMFKR
uniref:Uncharacterized protein n=1 Tax=Clytia hemisphaerica TaxID=252671 RepID=A0A7M5WQI3_9CNID